MACTRRHEILNVGETYLERREGKTSKAMEHFHFLGFVRMSTPVVKDSEELGVMLGSCYAPLAIVQHHLANK